MYYLKQGESLWARVLLTVGLPILFQATLNFSLKHLEEFWSKGGQKPNNPLPLEKYPSICVATRDKPSVIHNVVESQG